MHVCSTVSKIVIIGSFLAELGFNTDLQRRQQQQAALFAEHWHVTVLDTSRLPGLTPAQNVPLAVDTPEGRRMCVLDFYARNGHDGPWYTTKTHYGAGEPNMRFEMTCP